MRKIARLAVVASLLVGIALSSWTCSGCGKKPDSATATDSVHAPPKK